MPWWDGDPASIINRSSLTPSLLQSMQRGWRQQREYGPNGPSYRTLTFVAFLHRRCVPMETSAPLGSGRSLRNVGRRSRRAHPLLPGDREPSNVKRPLTSPAIRDRQAVQDRLPHMPQIALPASANLNGRWSGHKVRYRPEWSATTRGGQYADTQTWTSERYRTRSDRSTAWRQLESWHQTATSQKFTCWPETTRHQSTSSETSNRWATPCSTSRSTEGWSR